MTSLSVCPCCGSSSFSPHLKSTDHTVSHETFDIIRCNNCSFLATSPRPDDNELPTYYQAVSYISHNNRANSFFDIVYRAVRHYTLRWKHQLLNQYSQPGQSKILLDYGCGTGDFLHHCHKRGWNAYGVEPSTAARQQIPLPTKKNVLSQFEPAALPKANAITLWHVLEHIPDLPQTIAQLRDHLAPSGTLFIAVPNPNSQNAQHYGNTWAAYDVPRHLWHFTPSTMARILANHKLTIYKTLPMTLDAYYVSLLSEQYQNRAKPAAAINAFVQGVQSNRAAKRNGQYASLIYIVRP